jgi:hypothetical protein
MSEKQYANIKVRPETRQLLRMLSALLDKPMIDIIDRLAREEYKRWKELKRMAAELEYERHNLECKQARPINDAQPDNS